MKIFFREILENKNATFHPNGTLSFEPVRYSIPIPERSVGDPHKDIIISANLPLLGLSSAAAKISSFAALAVSTLAKSTNAQPMLNLTVHDYLWGYRDNLVSLANSIMPNYINFDRFGIMDRVRRLKLPNKSKLMSNFLTVIRRRTKCRLDELAESYCEHERGKEAQT